MAWPPCSHCGHPLVVHYPTQCCPEGSACKCRFYTAPRPATKEVRKPDCSICGCRPGDHYGPTAGPAPFVNHPYTTTPPATRSTPMARTIDVSNALPDGPATLPAPTTKLCGRCKADKPRTDFMKASSQKDGLDRWCKPCCADYQREWREKKAAAAAAAQSDQAQAERAPGVAQKLTERERHLAASEPTKPAAKPAKAPKVLAPEAVAAAEAAIEDPAFVGTDEGQATMEALAATAAAARRASWAEAKRRQREAAKAARA